MGEHREIREIEIEGGKKVVYRALLPNCQGGKGSEQRMASTGRSWVNVRCDVH